MKRQDIRLELEERIALYVRRCGSPLPERHAIAWRAYLAAILEWNIIDVHDYDILVQQIPQVPEDPSIAILLGRD